MKISLFLEDGFSNEIDSENPETLIHWLGMFEYWCKITKEHIHANGTKHLEETLKAKGLYINWNTSNGKPLTDIHRLLGLVTMYGSDSKCIVETESSKKQTTLKEALEMWMIMDYRSKHEEQDSIDYTNAS